MVLGLDLVEKFSVWLAGVLLVCFKNDYSSLASLTTECEVIRSIDGIVASKAIRAMIRGFAG